MRSRSRRPAGLLRASRVEKARILEGDFNINKARAETLYFRAVEMYAAISHPVLAMELYLEGKLDAIDDVRRLAQAMSLLQQAQEIDPDFQYVPDSCSQVISEFVQNYIMVESQPQLGDIEYDSSRFNRIYQDPPGIEAYMNESEAELDARLAELICITFEDDDLPEYEDEPLPKLGIEDDDLSLYDDLLDFDL